MTVTVNQANAAGLEAQKALYDAIAGAVIQAVADGGNARYQAQTLEHLARAFRHTVGGPQPGASVVEK